MFLAYFRRVNDYETLGGLFEHDKDEMIKKNLAQRLWGMSRGASAGSDHGNSDSGTVEVDIKEFKNSPECQFLKGAI